MEKDLIRDRERPGMVFYTKAMVLRKFITGSTEEQIRSKAYKYAVDKGDKLQIKPYRKAMDKVENTIMAQKGENSRAFVGALGTKDKGRPVGNCVYCLKAPHPSGTNGAARAKECPA